MRYLSTLATLLLGLAVMAMPVAAYAASVQSQIDALQAQIDAIELLPGPQGEIGPEGPPGDSAATSDGFEFFGYSISNTVTGAEAVGPIVVRAIRENRLHIFTHPAALPLADARFESIRRDFEAEARAQSQND